MALLLQAAWLCPMDAPPLRDGALLIDAPLITAVGYARDLRRRFPDTQVIDFADKTLLPGLINPHTHLELSALPCGPPWTGTLADWLINLMARAAAEEPSRSVAIGITQSLRFGVTCVGDITRHCPAVRAQLALGPLRAVSYGEIIALGARRGSLDQRLAAATDTAHAGPHVRIALSPHAPYTVEPDGYRRCLETARRLNLPLATHLAESPDEAEFLADHTGPFRRLWDHVGAWDQSVPRFAHGPVRFAKELGLLDEPTLLAHVNYCDDAELALLARARASVVYCPRTHAHFGHPPHRWRDMRAAGINVAVATDSCASAPDLNLVDDLRLLRRLAPQEPCARLWHMATLAAARAIGAEPQLGTLTAGKMADVVAFPAAGDDPLAQILDSPMLPTDVLLAGSRV